MISLQNSRVAQCRQYETAYPLGFPWNEENRKDIPRYFRGADGWWRDPQAQPSGKALLCCTGDLMCEPRQTRACQYGDSYFFQPMFQFVRDILRSSDLTMGNLETTVSDMTPYAGAYHTVAKKYHCNAPESYLDALRYAGFDALVNANNHNCDSGAAGLIETNERIDRHGFMRTGTFLPGETERVLLVKIKGIRVAILSYGNRYNGLDERHYTEKGITEILNWFSKEKCLADVAYARQMGAEFVLCYQHWGKDYDLVPNAQQEGIIADLKECGIDYIVGSHTHCFQSHDVAISQEGRKIPMMWSMGNFVTNERKTLCRHTGILQLTLERKAGKILAKEQLIPCYIHDRFGTGRFCVVPLDTTLNGGWQQPEKAEKLASMLICAGISAHSYPSHSFLFGICKCPSKHCGCSRSCQRQNKHLV